jgi:hypothetical protein
MEDPSVDDILAQERSDSIREAQIASKVYASFGQQLSKQMLRAQQESEEIKHRGLGAVEVRKAIESKMHIFIKKKVDDGEWTEDQRASAFEIMRLCIGAAQSVAETCVTHHEIRRGEAIGFQKAAEAARKFESGNQDLAAKIEESEPGEDFRFGGKASRVKEFQERRAERVKVSQTEIESSTTKEEGKPPVAEAPVAEFDPRSATRGVLLNKLRKLGVKPRKGAKTDELVKLYEEATDGVQDS